MSAITDGQSTDQLPAWAREIQTLVAVCPHFILSGNVHDFFFAPPDAGGDLACVDLSSIVTEALIARGIRLVILYEPTVPARVVYPYENGTTEMERLGIDLPDVVGGHGGGLAELQRIIAMVAGGRHANGEPREPVGLIIRYASRLQRAVDRLTDREFEFFRQVDRLCRNAARSWTAEGKALFNPIVWVVDSDRDLPSWFTLRNENVRLISVPLPDSGDRTRLANARLPALARATNHTGALTRPVAVLTEQTAGMNLIAVTKIIDLATDLAISPSRVDDAARSYRVGVLDNPWRADFIAKRLRDELKGEPAAHVNGRHRKLLSERILGQPDAIAKTLDILARSTAALTAAQAGPFARRPRGVLFFAGPTGVGKTELAKALTGLLLDNENLYVRFDMSEFSAEHAADRLIGAPPGYVGYDAGGELTNAIRERPFSVVLFDEIEKAHPRILDRLLQVLDDGRLTDGRGETVYFTEAVIVFTSNLGLYRDVRNSLGQVTHREPAVTSETHETYVDRADAIKMAIREHFTLALGRPELLNRIGEDNIVVFDFISEATAGQILDGMLRSISARLEREHGFPLTLTGRGQDELLGACTTSKVLEMGGRGVGAKLETALINPLSRLITLTPPAPGTAPTVDLSHDNEAWTAAWL